MKNKIILKTSFAGYPVGEYQLNLGEYCCIKDGSYKIHPDIVEGMKHCFEEVYEEEEDGYRYILPDGDITFSFDDGSKKYLKYFGNSYKTQEGAQAVADLRKHVYKFSMAKQDERNRSMSETGRNNGFVPVFDLYSPASMCLSATEEDRAERLKLIEDCVREN